MSYVLLVEDNPDNAHMIIRLLESVGFSVIHCERGMDGVKQARKERPILVLMDFNLPDINGSVLILTMKKILGGVDSPPFIAVTARTGEVERSVAKRYGYDAFISKPFDPQEFVDTVLRFAQPNLSK
jgi:DNA-binding response OmpR family regulator